MKLETISKHIGITKDKLTKFGILSLLKEKKMEIMRDRLEILSKYNITSINELEKKIKLGKIKENPAWEDLIVLENLEAKLKEIDNDIKNI